MKKIVFPCCVLFVLVLISCNQMSPTEEQIREVLNSELKFGQSDLVLHQGGTIPLDVLKSDYSFISVVFLMDGCSPCYPRFMEWHDKLDSLDFGENYTVLFVIDGQRYSDFLTKVLDLGYVEDRYYTVMDTDSKFLEANKDIPRWILDASVLIDAENKIKMVGAPWLNEEMTELFNSIVYEGK